MTVNMGMAGVGHGTMQEQTVDLIYLLDEQKSCDAVQNTYEDPPTRRRRCLD
jgi:hypothetical protein